jgi:hypothetical protein
VPIGHPVGRARGGGFARRGFRHRDQRLGVGQRVDRRQALRFAHTFERLERDVAQHRCRLRPHALVRIVARDRGEGRGIHQLRGGRAANPRVLVVARNLAEQVVFVDWNFLDERQPHGGIRVLLPRLRAKTVEDWHRDFRLQTSDLT